MNVRTVHRTSAMVLATFAALHIGNHLLGLGGVAAHQAAMDGLRQVYRAPGVEALLLASVVVQAATGLWMFFGSLRTRRGLVNWLQAGSGLLLGAYLSVHVAAVLYGRHQLQLDTDFFYAAAGLHVPATRGFFGPYYFLGVLALFVHVGCALHRLRQRRLGAAAAPGAARLIGGWSAAGAVVALVLVLLLAGAITPVEVPARYLATFQAPAR